MCINVYIIWTLGHIVKRTLNMKIILPCFAIELILTGVVECPSRSWLDHGSLRNGKNESVQQTVCELSDYESRWPASLDLCTVIAVKKAPNIDREPRLSYMDGGLRECWWKYAYTEHIKWSSSNSVRVPNNSSNLLSKRSSTIFNLPRALASQTEGWVFEFQSQQT